MTGRILLCMAWIVLLAAPIAMIIGHLGTHELSWGQNQISTYAARAPYDGWITASMLLSALALLCIGILFPSHPVFGQTIWSKLVSMLLGAAVAGLGFIAHFEETAMNLKQLKVLGWEAVRQQSFHDAGLLIFFYGTILALFLSGLIIMVKGPGWTRRILGGIVGISGPVAFLAMTASWTQGIGIAGTTVGLKQHAAFLCLWFGFGLLLVLLSKVEFQPGLKEEYAETGLAK